MAEIKKFDPLLDDPSIPEEASTFLHVYDETSDAHLALDACWKEHGLRVSFQKVQGWRRTIPAFAEAYETLRLICAGRIKRQFGEMAEDRLTGGQATFFAQQLNRLAPEEYHTQIVAQQHQTVTFKVEGGFQPLPIGKESTDVPKLQSGKSQDDK